MITFDDPIDRRRLEQFASQVKKLPQTLVADFQKNFRMDQSPEFYRGLLAAYCNAYVIVHGGFEGTKEDKTLGALIAYLSDEILKREWLR